MKVKFTVTTQGSVDGRNVKTYEAGKVYKVDGKEIDNFLIEGFIRRNFCHYVTNEEKMIEELDNKAITKVPENKSFGFKKNTFKKPKKSK